MRDCFTGVSLAALFVALTLSVSAANAEIVLLEGFQGTFGDVEANGALYAIEGATTGETVTRGLTADMSDQVIELTGWAADGDPVNISDLVLTGTNDISGTVTYKWQAATLSQLATPDDFGGSPRGLGGIVGSLVIEGNDTLTDVSTGDTFTLPEEITATFTYNGAYIDMDSGYPVPVNLGFASASLTVSKVPEPGTMMMAMFGLIGLVAIRRRR